LIAGTNTTFARPALFQDPQRLYNNLSNYWDNYLAVSASADSTMTRGVVQITSTTTLQCYFYGASQQGNGFNATFGVGPGRAPDGTAWPANARATKGIYLRIQEI